MSLPHSSQDILLRTDAQIWLKMKPETGLGGALPRLKRVTCLMARALKAVSLGGSGRNLSAVGLPLRGYSDAFRVRLLLSLLDKPSVSSLETLVVSAYEKVVLDLHRTERRA
jgi:hypothetical protein